MKKYRNVFNLLLLVILMTDCTPKERTLTIIHTNDTHSQVFPVTSGRNTGLGGYARRIGYIKQLRAEDPDLILLDAGDYSQGTPYFNFYKGRVEIDALNRMEYDAATLGNHEFDNGLDTLAAILKTAHFPIVCANYDVTNTPLEGIVQPYTIIRRKGLKIGVFGLGVNPQGLIADKNFMPIRYLNPITIADSIAALLRNEKHCDAIICLSHIGTEYADSSTVSDMHLIPATQNIDVVIGGHTHQVINNRHICNAQNESVLTTQIGKAGAKIGKIQLKIKK